MLTGQASMPPVEGLPVIRADLGPAGVGVPSTVMDEPQADATVAASTETDEERTYQIVGEDEADLKLGLVNISSPIARALIGKEEGDTAEVQAPSGVRRFEIVAVRYV